MTLPVAPIDTRPDSGEMAGGDRPLSLAQYQSAPGAERHFQSREQRGRSLRRQIHGHVPAKDQVPNARLMQSQNIGAPPMDGITNDWLDPEMSLLGYKIAFQQVAGNGLYCIGVELAHPRPLDGIHAAICAQQVTSVQQLH